MAQYKKKGNKKMETYRYIGLDRFGGYTPVFVTAKSEDEARAKARAMGYTRLVPM